jgi:uncharacterized protein
MRIAILLCCVTVVVCAVAQTAATVDVGALHTKAEASDPQAQFELGRAYFAGSGVNENPVEGVKWIRRAAEHGYIPAYNELGVLYRTGSGVEKDFEEAARWFRKGAKAGDGKARFNLAACYYNGDCAGVNNAVAFAWFVLSSDAGEAAAQDGVQRLDASMSGINKSTAYLTVAEMYYKGNEVERDYAKAYVWYSKAGLLGADEATLSMAGLQFDGLGVPKDEAKAVGLIEKLAKKGYKPAILSLARIYEMGTKAVPQNKPAAFDWYMRAAERFEPRAMATVGRMLLYGEAGKHDEPTACMWLLLAKSFGEKTVDLELKALIPTLTKKQKKDINKQIERWKRKTLRPVLKLEES